MSASEIPTSTQSSSAAPPSRQRSLSTAANTKSIMFTGNLSYRNVTPMDLSEVYSLEKASYPPDEAASRTKLQYRQHHAAAYFRCAILSGPDDIDAGAMDVPTAVVDVISDAAVKPDDEGTSTFTPGASCEDESLPNIYPRMIGYITATRCHAFNKESMSVHSSTGPLLAIHSIVIAEPYRRKGYASAMIDNYIKTVQSMDLKHGIQKIVLIAKANLLSFYVKNGFKVTKPSDIVHGGELWYECELELGLGGIETERGCQYWVVDSFAKYPIPGNILVTRGSGNPAAIVLVNASQIPSLVSSSMSINATTTVNTSLPSTDEINESETFSPNVVFDPDKEENIEWMKIVAKEFNLSETAFIWEYIPPATVTTPPVDVSSPLDSQKYNTLVPNNDGSTLYEIRFYTRNGSPVELCGHATLAASSVIFQIMTKYGKKRDEMSLSFRTQNGTILRAKPSNSSTLISSSSVPKGISNGTKVSMDFPWKVLKEWDIENERASAIQMIADVFFPDVDISIVEHQHIIFIGLENNGDDLLVELEYESFMSLPQKVQDINTTPLTLWNGYNRGVIICCCAPLPPDDEASTNMAASSSPINSPNINIDFFSRFFAPKIGIPEDSVTGSAHCLLGPYYGSKLDKRSVTGLQMSERGGIVECLLKKSGDQGNTVKKSVVLSGTAITTMSGILFL